MRIKSLTVAFLLLLLANEAFGAAPPSITSPTSATGTVGQVFSYVITGTKGTTPYTFSVAGALPDGLTFDNVDTISGTPTTSANVIVTLNLLDSASKTDSVQLHITINLVQNSTPFRFLTTSFPDGSTNAVYSATLLTANAAGTVTFGISSGALPTGLLLNTQTGLISGRPTVVETPAVTFSATDGTATVQLSTSIKISAAGGGGNGGVTFSTIALPSGRSGTLYSTLISTSGGVGPYTYGAQDLPPGTSFDGQTGAINGTPAAAGTFFVTFTAYDAGENNTVITTLALLVLPATSDFQFTTVLLNNGQVGTAYSDTWTVSNATGPVLYSASGLPSGLSLNASTGVVSGTPTTAGTFLVNLGANNGMDSITMNRTLWIAPSANSNFYWDFFGIPASFLNQLYTRQPPILVVTKNPAPGAGVTYAGIGFPAGITYSSTSGEISGTPTEVGIYPITLTATNSGGDVVLLSFDFVVLPTKGGDVNSIPANIWVSKQSVKKAGPGKDSWKAQYIYNADRRTATGFDPKNFNKTNVIFTVSLGSRTLSLQAKNLAANNGVFSYKGGTAPVQSVAIDTHNQLIKIATGSDTFTDSFPAVLRHTVMLGNKGYKLDEFFDSKGVFTPALAYRKTAFVVATGKITAGKGAGKDSASFAMLLADPAFDYMPGSTVFQFRLLVGGVPIVDKTFTSLVTGTETLDAKTGASVFKLKSLKNTAASIAISKFSYDSKTGKLTLNLKALNLFSLTGTEQYVTAELTVGTKAYTTNVTIFAPKAGAYSTKKP